VDHDTVQRQPLPQSAVLLREELGALETTSSTPDAASSTSKTAAISDFHVQPPSLPLFFRVLVGMMGEVGSTR